MRKLGIILAVMVAATLGYSGTASAQEQICEVTGGLADGTADSPINDTTAGLDGDCNESVAEQKLNANQTLCGLEKDVAESPLAPASEAVAGVHGGLDDNVEPPLDENIADIVDFDHPCAAGDDDDDDDGNGNGDDDDAQVEAVQRSNATADGGLPRTGGELFAGAGLGLMSLGALVRRFLP